MIRDVHQAVKDALDDIPTVWLEQCLAAIALDPDCAADQANQPVGLACGLARPEYGPAIYDLQCQLCEATWSGIPGDPCWWCEKAAERQIEHQIDLLLTGPDVDPDDVTYSDRMEAWIKRLIVAVEAELITQRQIETAWVRATRVRAA